MARNNSREHSVNVIRGTFRLSILVGLFALTYLWWDCAQKAGKAAADSQELWSTLRCAGYLLKLDTKPYENTYGNIDLGKHTHCVSRQFWANRSEIEEALREENPYQSRYDREISWLWQTAWSGAIAAFVITNLLGFAVLGLRGACRWVFAGYRSH